MNSPLRSRVFLAAAVGATALGLASSCLEPGSLDNEEMFRLGANFPPSDAALEFEGGAGCAEACALIETKCATAGCHAASGPAAGLDLASPNLVARLASTSATTLACSAQPLLVPGSPAQSTLYTKLLEPPSCGLKMPLGGTLSESEIDCMGRWVLAPSCGTEAVPDAAVIDAMSPVMPPPPPADGSAPPPPPPPPPSVVENIVMEAEDSASIIAPMEIGSDSLASGGSFISVPTGALKNDTPDSTTMGIASALFDVTQGGTYTIFGRVFTTIEDDDSFWVRIDTGAWIQWNNLPKGAWTWDDVHDTVQLDQTVTFELSPGQHTLTVMYREAGGRLDQLVVTNDPAFDPMGAGL